MLAVTTQSMAISLCTNVQDDAIVSWLGCQLALCRGCHMYNGICIIMIVHEVGTCRLGSGRPRTSGVHGQEVPLCDDGLEPC